MKPMARPFETAAYAYRESKDQEAGVTARHPVVVIGAGPVGLSLAIDLAEKDVPVVVLDDNDAVSTGSRAICFAKRQLEIFDRLGCGDRMVDKGVTWNKGKVFFDRREVYEFELLTETGHRRPAFINLQQYHVEKTLVSRIRALIAEGKPIELRGQNKVVAIGANGDHSALEVETPEGPYNIEADWLIACDGANSSARRMLGLEFDGRVFEDNFLIADVVMEAKFPTERWFWFDPPFNRGQSALLHRQPDNVWRIDMQLGPDIDRDDELKEANVRARLAAMLGQNAKFTLEWTSIYTFQCCRMERFRRGRILFAGDAAHQVSPFGARGANSGIQDADNLAWKLALVVNGNAPDALLDSYNVERGRAADENILHSTRSTEFITPKSDISRTFRDAVLDLAENHDFARSLINSGRLSEPTDYIDSPLNGADAQGLPARTGPGAPASDAPIGDGWLLDRLGDHFVVLAIGQTAPARFENDGFDVDVLSLPADASAELAARYLGAEQQAVYLIRPDQHIAARWREFNDAAIRTALEIATANSEGTQR